MRAEFHEPALAGKSDDRRRQRRLEHAGEDRDHVDDHSNSPSPGINPSNSRTTMAPSSSEAPSTTSSITGIRISPNGPSTDPHVVRTRDDHLDDDPEGASLLVLDCAADEVIIFGRHIPPFGQIPLLREQLAPADGPRRIEVVEARELDQRALGSGPHRLDATAACTQWRRDDPYLDSDQRRQGKPRSGCYRDFPFESMCLDDPTDRDVRRSRQRPSRGFRPRPACRPNCPQRARES